MEVTNKSIQWWTWNPERPAAISNLVNGIVITPVLYSAKEDCATLIEPSKEIEYGKRNIDGSTIFFRTKFSGTVISWQYHQNEDADLKVKWSVEEYGEWGLRFWVSLSLEGTEWVYEESEKRVTGIVDEYNYQAFLDPSPLMVTGHKSLKGLVNEFDEKGYFFLDSRAKKGDLLALRYNLEENPTGSLTLSNSNGYSHNIRFDQAVSQIESPCKSKRSLQAIYDVISWNHVYDKINQRPYTCLSRNWNTKKFGGFGVWLNDVLFNALLWSFFDVQKAIENLEAVVAWQTNEGNYACLVTGNDQWVDRSQPPIAAWVLWNVWQRSQNDEILKQFYESVLRNHEWWHRKRTLNDLGLVAYGTSQDIGNGLYKGTKLGAKNESSMDNSPVHDQAYFNPQSGLLESADVGLNSLLCLDGEMLSLMADHLGQNVKSDELKKRVEQHRERISKWLWDDRREVFANRMVDGSFVNSIAPTSFYPLIAGAASKEQQRSLVENYLLNQNEFGGEYVLPSVSRGDPAFNDNVYWRGRVWGPLNYWTYFGLKRTGLLDEASWLAEKSYNLFMKGWDQRLCGENYNADNGQIKDQSDTDEFYSWGALLPGIHLAETFDINPWQGLSIDLNADFEEIGPVSSPFGKITIQRTEDFWTLNLDQELEIKGNQKSKIENLQISSGLISFTIEQMNHDSYFELSKTVNEVQQNGNSIRFEQNKIYFKHSNNPQNIKISFLT